MRKFFTVCLWLGLGACLIGLMSLTGTASALRAEIRADQRRYAALQTLYDRAKDDLNAAQETQSADQQDWLAAKKSLEEELEGLRAELTAAREELDARRAAAEGWDRERQEWAKEKAALTESLDAAEGRIDQVTALLLPPTEAPAPTDAPEEKNLFSLPIRPLAE